MKKILFLLTFAAGISATAQVKVGTNPTVLATNANFQVEGTTTADQFVVLKNGNVGIGNTTPTNRLTVAGFGFNPSVNDLAAIKVEGGYGGGIVFSEGVNRSSIYSNSGSALVFTTGGSASGLIERMRIDATGNLGIGTTVPTEKLDVAGNVKFSGALMPNNVAGTAGQILTSAGAGTAPTWVTNTFVSSNLYTADGTLSGNRTVTQGTNNLNFTGTGLTTFTSGAIGIGTIAPSQKLEVFGNFLLNSENSGFGVDSNPIARLGFVKRSGANPVIASSAGNPIIFSQSDQTGVLVNLTSAVLTERMRIDATGNLGIGTITPTNKLSVVGIANSMIASFSDGSVITKFFNGTNSSGQTAGFLGTTTFNDFALFTGSQTRLTIQNATGNIGIGTNAPTSLLSLSGANRDIGFYSNGTTINSGKIAIIKSVEIDEGNGHLVFETYRGGFGGGEKMRITNEGNVGIGVTVPGAKLDVNGVTRATTFTFPNPAGDIAPVITARTVPNGQGDSVEKSELILFHANDGTVSNGEDQITLRAPALSFQTYNNDTVVDINNNAGYNERMRIVPNGNIGIGTKNPTSKLQIPGLPIHASNAAATTAGLTAGAFYHNGDGILRVVL